MEVEVVVSGWAVAIAAFSCWAVSHHHLRDKAACGMNKPFPLLPWKAGTVIDPAQPVTPGLYAQGWLAGILSPLHSLLKALMSLQEASVPCMDQRLRHPVAGTCQGSEIR